MSFKERILEEAADSQKWNPLLDKRLPWAGKFRGERAKAFKEMRKERDFLRQNMLNKNAPGINQLAIGQHRVVSNRLREMRQNPPVVPPQLTKVLMRAVGVK